MAFRELDHAFLFFYSLEKSKICPLLLIILAGCNQDQKRKVSINRLCVLSSVTQRAINAFRQGSIQQNTGQALRLHYLKFICSKKQGFMSSLPLKNKN